MITLDPYDPIAGQGDVIGFYATAAIVVMVVVLGAASLMFWRDRSKAGDSFADDFIPDRAVVGKTSASKPDMRGKR